MQASLAVLSSWLRAQVNEENRRITTPTKIDQGRAREVDTQASQPLASPRSALQRPLASRPEQWSVRQAASARGSQLGREPTASLAPIESRSQPPTGSMPGAEEEEEGAIFRRPEVAQKRQPASSGHMFRLARAFI